MQLRIPDTLEMLTVFENFHCRPYREYFIFKASVTMTRKNAVTKFLWTFVADFSWWLYEKS